jgi:hypothetical protein
MARTIGSVQKSKPKKTGNTPEEFLEYKRRYNLQRYEAKKAAKEAAKAEAKGDMEEMERINLSPYDHIKTLKITIDLFGDEDDIEALRRFEMDMRMANMVYAHETGDYSGLKGIIYEII